MDDTPAFVGGNKLHICAEQVRRANECFSLRLNPGVGVLVLLFLPSWRQTFTESTQAPLCPAYLISSALAKFQPATIFGHSAPFFCGIALCRALSLVIEARTFRNASFR